MNTSAGEAAARADSAPEAVEHQLLPIPDDARTSTAGHQFWIWAGANLAPINWVLGALGIGLGLSLADTILVLVIGNIIGMAAFGFFVLMGQRTGVSQMVLSPPAGCAPRPSTGRSTGVRSPTASGCWPWPSRSS